MLVRWWDDFWFHKHGKCEKCGVLAKEPSYFILCMLNAWGFNTNARRTGHGMPMNLPIPDGQISTYVETTP